MLYSVVQYYYYYMDGKGQCGGTIGAVIYLNKANAIRESEYTSLKTH